MYDTHQLFMFPPLLLNRSGNTVLDTFIDLVEGAFNVGRRQVPDFTNWITLYADRQYLRRPLLAYYLPFGGDVLGSIMRQEWLAFTYGKEKKKKKSQGVAGTSASSSQPADKPFNITINGFKDVFQKYITHGTSKHESNNNQKLTATAFKNGVSSAVHLCIHSFLHDSQWDIVTASPSQKRAYDNDESKWGLERGLDIICSTEDHDHIALFKFVLDDMYVNKIGISFLTVSQLDVLWFVGRAFSLTSSTTMAVIKELAKTVEREESTGDSDSNSESSESSEPSLFQAFETVLGYTRNLNLLKSAGDDTAVDGAAVDEEGGAEGNENDQEGNDADGTSTIFEPSDDAKEQFSAILAHLNLDR